MLSCPAAIPRLVAMLGRGERKVAQHCAAALQNLTYKNAACCQFVVDEGGEKVRAREPGLRDVLRTRVREGE